MGNEMNAREFFAAMKADGRQIHADKKGVMVRLTDKNGKLNGYIFGRFMSGNRLAIVKQSF